MKTLLVFVSVLIQSFVCKGLLYPDEFRALQLNINKNKTKLNILSQIKVNQNKTELDNRSSDININRNVIKLDNHSSRININNNEIKLDTDFSQINNNKHDTNLNNLLTQDCGNVRPTWRGESGVTRSELYEFPFYVDLIYENDGNSINKYNNSIHCGGILINDQFVVTAASCIKTKPEVIAVRLGDHDLDTNPDCLPTKKYNWICAPPTVDLKIKKEDIIVHNSYTINSTARKYDIALIRLPEKVNFTDAIEPVCLPVKEIYRKQTNLTVIGFPQIDNLTPRNNTLLRSSIPHVTNENCQILLNKTIGKNHLCAAGENREKYCHGYGGNGFFYSVVEDYRIRWVLAAIVPYGMNICNKHDLPKIFPRMEIYNKWILENIKKFNKDF